MSDKEKKTVLLLSAPVGAGHVLAAEALREYLEKKENIRVVHGNIFNFFPAFLGQAFLSCYLGVLEYAPWLYESAYKWGNQDNGSLWFRGMLNHLLAFLGKRYLDEVNPDAVIATHATPAGIVSIYKKSHPQLWLGAVITDYTIHRWWLCDGVDTYFLADESLRDKVNTSAEIFCSGIPVRADFKFCERSAVREKYGWREDEKVCLIMGGGEGLLPMQEILRELEAHYIEGLRLIAVTGRNEKMKRSLLKYDHVAEIYGYRDDVPQMMCGADIMITKAGGLTCSEALLAGVQLLIYKPLPGQEAGNAEFFERHCGVKIVKSIDELGKTVEVACAVAKRNGEPSSCGHPFATEDICAYVVRKLPI
ncbi:MAG: glycosyltransferase [Acidaminococcaceae bacterium]|nr:glycosyltransferase [Acidaminococcaceae bacterium]